MTTRLLGLVLLLAAPASAHLVPVQPSTCALTLGLAAADGGVTATVDPAGPNDVARVTYEPDASPARSRVQVCPADPANPAAQCGPTVPRGFTAGPVTGTMALPAAFELRLLSSGELSGTVPVSFATGGDPVVVPFEAGTGLVVSDGTPLLGAPIDAGGTFTLVGTGSGAGLPAPLGGTTLRLTVSCTLAPPPDVDQFALAAELTKVRGTFTTKRAKLVVVMESQIAMSPDGNAPTVLHLAAGDAALLQSVLALQPGKGGRSVSSGGELTVVPLRRRTSRAQKLIYRSTTVPAGPFAGGDGVLAVSTSGLMARRSVGFKANGRGTRLTVREQ